jgi:hypothetical protein
MSQAPEIDYNALWQYVTQQLKSRTSLPALWRALEAARPIVIEGDNFILGFRPADGHMQGFLLEDHYKNLIQQSLETATRRRLNLNIIIGETVEDWESEKARREEAERLQQQAREQYRKHAESGQTWDQVGEQLVRKFSGVPHRGLSSVQARFLDECLDALVEAHRRLMAAEPTELEERAYSRVLDRLSERVMVPSTLIGYLVRQRLK